MIIEISLKQTETIPQLKTIVLNSDYPKKLAPQWIYECFIPACIEFQAILNKFEIERNALVIILSTDTSRIIYPFDACRFHNSSLAEFTGILASYNFRSYIFLDRRHESVFSRDVGYRIDYTKADDFNAYIKLCREKDAIYPIFASFNKRK